MINSVRRWPVILAALALTTATFASDNGKRTVPGPGDVPPPVLGRDLEGQIVELSPYAGKALVITFWATWCPYCIKELPILERAEIALGSDNLQVFAVSSESDEVFRLAAKALSAQKMRIVHDTAGAAVAYGARTIPHMVIVGRDGRIVSVRQGYAESELPAIVDDINKAIAVSR